MTQEFSKLEFDMDFERPRNSRKRKLAALIISGLFDITQTSGKKFNIAGRGRNIFRADGRNIAVSKIISLANNQPKYFQKMYRLHVDDFWSVYTKIKPELTRRKTTEQPISCVLKLCSFLRWIAGGIHHDIAFGYNLPHGSIHAICKEVAIAIDKHDIANAEVLEELELGSNIFWINLLRIY